VAPLGRVEPENVRHLQLQEAIGLSTVGRILLPSTDEGEFYKYVKEPVFDAAENLDKK